jgi:sugar/nucleoside kinase (ribokinase family)
MAIAVVGSANMDLVVRTEAFPRPGQTVLGSEFATFPGGKGANQAVAIGRLGGEAALVGRVGRDAFGDELRASLEAAGVSCEFLLRDEEAASGIAAIAVDVSGQNTIVVAAGDAFSGAFALFLSQGREIEDALRMANVVGALSVTRAGAQASMPSLEEAEQMLA